MKPLTPEEMTDIITKLQKLVIPKEEIDKCIEQFRKQLTAFRPGLAKIYYF